LNTPVAEPRSTEERISSLLKLLETKDAASHRSISLQLLAWAEETVMSRMSQWMDLILIALGWF
jgi:hypothetical protein